MAIVKEFTARNGAHVIVRDDCYRDASPEELERRYEEIRRAIIFAETRAAEVRMRKEREARELQGRG